FTLFDVGDGLKSSTCVGNFQPAAWKGGNGRLFFPTRRGVAWVDPEGASADHAPPAPVVERVVIDGAPQASEGLVAVPPGRGDVTVDYTAPRFRNPAALR